MVKHKTTRVHLPNARSGKCGFCEASFADRRYGIKRGYRMYAHDCVIILFSRIDTRPAVL